jgi:hypothetical protein
MVELYATFYEALKLGRWTVFPQVDVRSRSQRIRSALLGVEDRVRDCELAGIVNSTAHARRLQTSIR